VHSCALVILAGLIVDHNTQEPEQYKPCLIDRPRALYALERAQTFLSDQPGVEDSAYRYLPSSPARRTARRCSRMIAAIKKALSEASTNNILERDASWNQMNLSTQRTTVAEGSQNEESPISASSRALQSDGQSDDLMRAFLELVPHTAQSPNTAGPMKREPSPPAALTEPTSNQDGSSLMSSWSMRDLLAANCLPSCVSLGTCCRRIFH
jgi:hypothetical protein